MKLSSPALKRLFTDLLRKRLTDAMFDTLIESLWRDPVTEKDEKVKFDAGDPTAGYLATKIIAGTNIAISEGTEADQNKLKISLNDNDVKISFDFITSDMLVFVYNCPVALVFTSQESENSDATISPALGTNLNQYDKVTITASEVGLIVLNGHTL